MAYMNGVPTIPPVPTEPVAESHTILRERTFHRDDDVNYLLGLLRNQGVTGTLMIDLSQGAVNSIRLTEKQKIKIGE